MVQQFETISIRPNWRYFALRVGWLVLLSLALLFAGGMEGMQFHRLWFISSAVVGLFSLYEFIFLRMVRFTLTDEQLIVQKGVFHRACDYLELYRIVDFTEQQSLLQQMLGLKTVLIYSSDRTNPTIHIFGVCSNRELVSVIRQRVIYNRSIRNIHEFSNII